MHGPQTAATLLRGMGEKMVQFCHLLSEETEIKLVHQETQEQTLANAVTIVKP